MTSLWSELREKGAKNGLKHKIHVESGHFSNLQIYELYVKYAVENADSLGMNESELNLLSKYWSNALKDINSDAKILDTSIENTL
jgi:ADP-dependent phosphofructokinase/glucokinase